MNILDKRFVWTPSAKTDIRNTFAKYGFVGPEARRMAKTIATVAKKKEVK